jgi:hypothetical protein
MRTPTIGRSRFRGRWRRWRQVLGGGCVLAFAAGCQVGHGVQHPQAIHPVVFKPGVTSLNVTLPLAEQIDVVLLGPTVGSDFAWEVVSNNDRVLEQEGPLRFVPPAAGAGPAGTTKVSFFALKPGRSIIRWVLVRTNEAVAVPSARCEVFVTVPNR